MNSGRQPNFYAFDLETAAVWEEGKPFSPADGLGISCAAMCSHAGNVWFWWGGMGDAYANIMGYANMSEAGRRTAIAEMLSHHPKPDRQMSAEGACYLVDDLSANQPVITWNGLGFDMHVLAVESGEHEYAAELARNHVDLMFAFQSVKGYRLSLKAAAEGVGSRKGVAGADNGADAPALWRAGDYVTALQYVAQDVIALRDVTAAVIRDGGFSWTAKSGRVNYVSFPRADLEALRVSEVVQWPEPDQSWMDAPVNRHECYAWMKVEATP